MKKVGVTGGAIYAVSLLICCFTQNVVVFVLSFGVLGGIGAGMVFLPAVVLIGHYFKKKRALATTLARVGSPMGGFLLVPLSNHIIQTAGWHTAFYVLCCVSSVCPLLGLLMRPPKPEDVEEDFSEDFAPPPVVLQDRRRSMYLDLPLQAPTSVLPSPRDDLLHAEEAPERRQPVRRKSVALKKRMSVSMNGFLEQDAIKRTMTKTKRKKSNTKNEKVDGTEPGRAEGEPDKIVVIVEADDSGRLSMVDVSEFEAKEHVAILDEALGEMVKKVEHLVEVEEIS